MQGLIDPADEAAALLEAHGGVGGLPQVQAVLESQFSVLQTRTQLILTLATIVLTITGFSGPRIAESGVLARWSMAGGLLLVLAAVLLALVGSLGIRWVTQAATPESGVEGLRLVIAYRNRKTRAYQLQLGLLGIGLGCYVTSVIAFLLAM